MKESIPVSEDRQGYIYYISRLYDELPQRKKARIDEICGKAGGEYAEALKTYVTGQMEKTKVCERFYISESTLFRAVKKYFMMFPKAL